MVTIWMLLILFFTQSVCQQLPKWQHNSILCNIISVSPFHITIIIIIGDEKNMMSFLDTLQYLMLVIERFMCKNEIERKEKAYGDPTSKKRGVKCFMLHVC